MTDTSKLGCFCCTCSEDQRDPACRDHGAHGLRECLKHNCPPVPCKWDDGCGMTIDKVIAGAH